jgi:UDP-N-acetylbacillosamine N-acetyltransferase
MKKLYIYGASGHGLVVADVAKRCGYDDVVFIDDGENEYLSFEGICDNKQIYIAFGIGNNSIREKLFYKALEYNIKIVTLVDPSAVISSSAEIGRGSVIMPNVVVNAKAIIAEGVILNSGCIVEHESVVESFVHVSPNVALAGNVKVGTRTHIGIGSNVIQGIMIGKNNIIGAGTVIIKDTEDNKKVVGVPGVEINAK